MSPPVPAPVATRRQTLETEGLASIVPRWLPWAIYLGASVFAVWVLLVPDDLGLLPGSRLALVVSVVCMQFATVWRWSGRVRDLMVAVTCVYLFSVVLVLGAVIGLGSRTLLVAACALLVQALVTVFTTVWLGGPIGRELSGSVDLLRLVAASVAGTVCSSTIWLQLHFDGLLDDPGHGLVHLLQGASGAFIGMAEVTVLLYRPPLPDLRRNSVLEYVWVLVFSSGAMLVTFGLLGPGWTWAVILPALWLGMRMAPFTTVVYVLITQILGTIAQSAAPVGEWSTSDRELTMLGGATGFAAVALALTYERLRQRELIEEVRVERALAHQQARALRVTFDSMTDGVVVLAGGKAIDHNERAAELLGHAFLSTPTSEWPASEEVQRSMVFAGDVLHLQRTSPLDPNVHLSIEVAGMTEESGGEALMLVRDITTQQQRMAELTEFASVAAHDLKTPLASLSGWLELARDSLPDDPAGAIIVIERSQQSAVRLNEQIENWLAFNVARGGRLEREALDLRADVEQLQAIYPEATISNEVHHLVSGDPTLLRQLLNNLVSNSVKYARPDEQPSIVVATTLRDDGWIELSVADEGIGIPEGHEEAVFQRFTRAVDAESLVSGTGMGLAMCRQVARRHGGDISAVRNDAGGTTITCVLPAPTA